MLKKKNCLNFSFFTNAHGTRHSNELFIIFDLITLCGETGFFFRISNGIAFSPFLTRFFFFFLLGAFENFFFSVVSNYARKKTIEKKRFE